MDWRQDELFSVFRQPLCILWMTSYFCKGRAQGHCSWNNPCLQKGSGQRHPASGWRFRNIWFFVYFIFVFMLLYVWRPTWALGLMKGSPGPSFLSGLSFPPRPEGNFDAAVGLLGTCWTERPDFCWMKRSIQFVILSLRWYQYPRASLTKTVAGLDRTKGWREVCPILQWKVIHKLTNWNKSRHQLFLIKFCLKCHLEVALGELCAVDEMSKETKKKPHPRPSPRPRRGAEPLRLDPVRNLRLPLRDQLTRSISTDAIKLRTQPANNRGGSQS